MDEWASEQVDNLTEPKEVQQARQECAGKIKKTKGKNIERQGKKRNRLNAGVIGDIIDTYICI